MINILSNSTEFDMNENAYDYILKNISLKQLFYISDAKL